MRYKVKEGFELKNIAGDMILLPRGAATADYNYVMVFNETGAFIYESMGEYKTADELAALLAEKYSIDIELAKKDVDAYIAKMLENGIAEAEQD